MLKNLNKEQIQAVTHKSGPLLIVAGAGTGKTTAITKRLAWLILAKKLKPENILALTFTEKAAQEMEERVDQLMPYGYTDLWIETFHSFCDRILKDNALDIGLDPNFKLLTQAEQWMFIKSHLFDFDLDYYRPLGNPNSFISELTKHFSRAKDEDVSPDEYLDFAKQLKPNNDLDQEQIEKITEISQAYKKYQELMAKESNLDFGDLILYTLRLFKKRKHLLKKYQQQFQHILVDEFQDTNYAQYKLLQLLTPPQNNLTVVGDDDQAIYKFRGASVSNILQFQKDFPKTKKIILTQNYRSQQPILDLSYLSIQNNNPNRLEAKYKINKKLKSNSKPINCQSISHLHNNTLEKETISVINKIIEIKNKEKCPWSNFAILIRANSSADIFINLLASKKIPYQFLASRGLYSSPEIMDMISYLRVINNFYDDINLFRILSLNIFKLNLEDITKALIYSKRKNIPLFDVIINARQVAGLDDKTIGQFKLISELIKSHANLAKEKNCAQVLLEFIKSSGYLKSLQEEKSTDSEKKILNISLFFKKIQENEKFSVSEFISQLDLMIEAGDDPSPVQLEEGPDSIKIMTIHSAKGLEFENVFVVNLVKDKFPTRERKERIELPLKLIKEKLPEGNIHLQEERRLFYVAMTRAKKRLFLTSAEDYGGKRKKKISQFLIEIKKELDKLQINRRRTSGSSPSLSVNLEKQVSDNLSPPNILKQKISYQLPSKFSYTQLKVFETCPYQYRYTHILRLPPRGAHTASYGRTMHSTMQKFFQEIQKGHNPKKEDLINYYQSFWISDFYLSKSHELKRKQEGQKALAKFYQENKNNFKSPLFLEKGFNLKIGEHILRGQIDRVDKLSDNSVEIIDYKTGKPPKNDSEVKRNDQLLIYSIACQKVLKLKPTKLSLYFIDQNKKISVDQNPKAEEKIIQKIQELISKIKQSQFTATPGYHCQFCDYKDICEHSAK